MITIGLVWALIAVLWADVHFLLAVFRARHLWDIIPLIGMGFLTFAIGWFLLKLWELRVQPQLLSNLFANMVTVFRAARDRPARMTQSPASFEREFRQWMDAA